MRYKFIQSNKADHTISKLCKTLNVSRSGYYDWLKRPLSTRAQFNAFLLTKIKSIHKQFRGVYGAVKTWIELNNQGYICGLNKVINLRRGAGIVAKRVIRFKQVQSGKIRTKFAPNLLSQDFSADNRNTKWVCDTTFIPIRKGWLYLATVMDLFSRKVIGWSMSNKNDKKLVKAALQMAIKRRKPNASVICHSDQGAQYNSFEYKRLLDENNMIQSMSRKGCCWDNAVAESFFNNIKNEMVWHNKFNCRDEAKTAIFDYIEIFYNRQRIHQSLGYKTPNDFEQCVI